MELTPRLLTEVNFKEQWRGYSQSEVDEFLARVATGVGELQERLREATERASAAERKLLDRTDDDEVRRTLVLAQRTAAAALDEARAEADQILADARAAAGAAESDLGERRLALQRDIDALTAHAAQLRDQLRAELRRMLDALESPDELPAPPVLVAAPDPDETPVAEAEPYVPRPPTDDELARARDDLVTALRDAGLGEVFDQEVAADPAGEPTQVFDVLAAEEAEPEAEEPEPEAAALEWHEPDPEPEPAYAAPADAHPVDEAPEPDPGAEDDPFLAELRRAVTDETPLGPRDVEHDPTGTDVDDGVPSSRFRLRRGR